MLLLKCTLVCKLTQLLVSVRVFATELIFITVCVFITNILLFALIALNQSKDF